MPDSDPFASVARLPQRDNRQAHLDTVEWARKASEKECR